MEKFVADTFKLTGIRLSTRQTNAFELYQTELISWNEKFNLTAIRDSEGIRVRHFLDSLTALSEMGFPFSGKLVDIGTGAGFPGIPLKIVSPEMKLTLVESVSKKAQFCQHLVDTLQLENVEVLSFRAEELGISAAYREKFDWGIARAVASLPALVEYLLPLVRVGGAVLAQKGENAHAEVQHAERAIRLLGGRLRTVKHVTLPCVADERFLVVIDKVAATPPQYPRRAGVPLKKPL